MSKPALRWLLLSVIAAVVLVGITGSNRLAAISLILAVALLEVVLGRRVLPAAATAIAIAGAIGVALLAGALAAAPLLLVPPMLARDPLALRGPGLGLAAPAGLAVLYFAGVSHSRNSFHTVALLLPAAALIELLRPMYRTVSNHTRLTADREHQIQKAAAGQSVASDAHDDLAGVARALEQTRALALRADDRSGGTLISAIDAAITACLRARRDMPTSAFPDDVDPSDPASSILVDRWARIEKTPNWWPRAIRELWATTVAAWFDGVRQLHTREIERVALAGTLGLRAALLLAAPAAGFLTVDGVVPLAHNTSTFRDACWAACTIWVVATAVGSRALVRSTIDSGRARTRSWLASSESLLAVLLLLTDPSWLAFAFVSGPVNWLMRPMWRLRWLVGAVATALGVLLLGLVFAGRFDSPQRATAEVALAILCLVLVSNSFGLMFPLVVVHAAVVLPTWHLREGRLLRAERRRRIGPLAVELDAAIEAAAQESPPSARAAEVERELLEIRQRVGDLLDAADVDSRLVRRRNLASVVGDALEQAILDPAHPLRCAAPAFTPTELGRRQLRTWGAANALEIALKRIVAEAVRHGEFEVRCFFGLTVDADAGGLVHVRVENDLPVERGATILAEGRGGREIVVSLARLPGTLVQRGLATSDSGIPIFKVEFSFSELALEKERT